MIKKFKSRKEKLIPQFHNLFLIIKENLTPIKGEFVGKGIVLIIAWQIWLASTKLVDYFAPVKKGFEYVKEEPWGMIKTFGSLFLAARQHVVVV